MVELVEEQPEEQPAGEQLPPEQPPYALLSVLGVRSWLLVSALFMLAFRAIEVRLGMRFWTWYSMELGFWLSESFQPHVAASFYNYIAVFARYAFPVLFNLLFFCLVFFILRRRSPLGYLTLRNVGIIAAMTIGGIYLRRLIFPTVQFLSTHKHTDFDLLNGLLLSPYFLDNTPVIVVALISLAICSMLVISEWPGVVAPLALIYRFTIAGLPLRTLFLSKTVIGALIIAILLSTAELIYLLYFFAGGVATFPPLLMTGYVWPFKLHLLWVGLLFREPESKPEEIEHSQ